MEILNKQGKLEQASFLFKEVPKRKIDFEFQALGIEMMDHFGKEYRKRIWPLFYKFPLGKIIDSYEVYKKSKVKTFDYFYGILLKM